MKTWFHFCISRWKDGEFMRCIHENVKRMKKENCTFERGSLQITQFPWYRTAFVVANTFFQMQKIPQIKIRYHLVPAPAELTIRDGNRKTARSKSSNKGAPSVPQPPHSCRGRAPRECSRAVAAGGVKMVKVKRRADEGKEPPSQDGGRATELTRGKSHRANKGEEPPRQHWERATEPTRGRSHRAETGGEPPS
jgi:hypothetical protein